MIFDWNMDGYHFFAISSDGESGGIYDVTLDTETGAMTSSLRTRCPHLNYLIHDPARKMFYGSISRFAADGTGGLAVFDADCKLLRSVPTDGKNTCHLTLSPDGKFLYTAQYGDGSISEFPLDDAGEPGAPRIFRQRGKGDAPDRQSEPHAHFAGFSPEGDRLLTVDLGLDSVFIYPWQEGAGITGEPAAVQVPAGDGPRHLIFSAAGDRFFTANELGSTASTFAWQDGGAELLETVTTLVQTPVMQSWPGAIRLSPDGKYLLISNRGDDSIAAFEVMSDGLKLIRTTGCGGHWPRDFVFTPDGKFVITANERSGNLASFRYCAENGGLIPCGRSAEIPAVLNFLCL